MSKIFFSLLACQEFLKSGASKTVGSCIIYVFWFDLPDVDRHFFSLLLLNNVNVCNH